MVRHGLLIVALLVAVPARASHELARITEDPQLLHKFAEMLTHASTFVGWEVAAFVVREPDGNLQCVLWPTSGRADSQVFQGTVPDNVVAIVHTHPQRMDRKPSDGDIALARRLGLPNYVLSRYGIYAAEPSGEVVPVVEQMNWTTSAMRSPACKCSEHALDR
jgi:proteasome lid subunit RPN8/RPN11